MVKKNMSVVLAAAAGGISGAAAGPVIAIATIQAAGFGASGIAAGTPAAGLMSAAAMANGGGVAAGSTVAVLQSAGAAGLTAGMVAGAATAGAGAGVLAVGCIAVAGLALAERLGRCKKARAAAAKSAAPALGVWTVATEEGMHNVKCYAFKSKRDAENFAKEIVLAWVMYDDCMEECKHGGFNPCALSTIRVSMSRSFAGKWKVATEEGPGNVQVYFFDSERNARAYAEGLFVSRILIDPQGQEIWHSSGGNMWAVNTIRTKMLQDPAGKWKVATEEGPGNVKVYKFSNESNAHVYARGLFVSRILINTQGQEIWHSSGGNQCAVNTIRTKMLQDPAGKWKVATEEGPGNVKVYDFSNESNAHVYFGGLFVSRILINPQGQELGHGGWNPWALATIRRKVCSRSGR